MSNNIETGIEQLTPLYVAPEIEAKISTIARQRIYRVEIGAGRHYRNEGGQTFKSITTLLDAVMPANRFLQSWRESKIEELGTVEAAKDFVKATADYGTALHIAVADFCRKGGVNWLEFSDWAFMQLSSDVGLSGHALHAGVDELTRDFAAIIQFLHEYECTVLAVEIPVFSSHGFATLIDLVVEMNEKAYTDKTPPEKRKRIVAAGNLKSGKKGFYESHIFQLCGERMAFNETYGKALGYNITEVFNLAPTDWTKEPGYKYKNQTAAIDETTIAAQFDLFLNTAKLRGVLGPPSKKFTIFEGVTAYGKSPIEQMRTIEYDEFAQIRIEQANAPLFDLTKL